nr:MAG TPA: hypothetical protein [Caudoviricetes sp.]
MKIEKLTKYINRMSQQLLLYIIKTIITSKKLKNGRRYFSARLTI